MEIQSVVWYGPRCPSPCFPQLAICRAARTDKRCVDVLDVDDNEDVQGQGIVHYKANYAVFYERQRRDCMPKRAPQSSRRTVHTQVRRSPSVVLDGFHYRRQHAWTTRARRASAGSVSIGRPPWYTPTACPPTYATTAWRTAKRPEMLKPTRKLPNRAA